MSKATTKASNVTHLTPSDPTDPGDTIEVSITQEVKDKKGRSLWAKVGVTIQQRDDEDTEDAFYRAQDFVVGRVSDLMEEYLS